MGIFEFPEDIKYLIFGYCFDSYCDDIFDKMSWIYVIKLFKFNKNLIPLIMEENPELPIKTDPKLSRFEELIITIPETMEPTKKSYTNIVIETEGKLPEKSVIEKTKSLSSEHLTIFKPDSEMLAEFADLIENSQNISVQFPENVDIISKFKRLNQLYIKKNDNKSEKLPEIIPDINSLILYYPIDEEDLKQTIKKFKNVKNLTIADGTYMYESSFADILPDSILSLKIGGSVCAFTKTGNPVYRDLKISELILDAYVEFNFEPTGKNPVFPKNLTRLFIDDIQTLITKDNRGILPNRKLKYLKMGINHETTGFSFCKKGKKHSSIPDVETLKLDFSHHEFLGHDEDIKFPEIIIPESVVNLELFQVPDLNIKKIGIVFENPENLRSLIITVYDEYTKNKPSIDSILRIGKLESLVIKRDESRELYTRKTKIEIPDSLRILISEIPVKLIGSSKKIIYMKIGS